MAVHVIHYTYKPGINGSDQSIDYKLVWPYVPILSINIYDERL